MNNSLISIKLQDLKKRLEQCLEQNKAVEKNLDEQMRQCLLMKSDNNLSNQDRLEYASAYIEAKEQYLYLTGETNTLNDTITEITKILEQ